MERRVLLAMLAVAIVACVGPARSYAVYESRATQSAAEAQSDVQTALAGIGAALDDDAFAPYVSVLMKDAEEGASTALGHFSSIQPPDTDSDRLRDQLLPLLQGADDAIARARIAARRGDASSMAQMRGQLSDIAHRLSAFLERHEP